MCAGSTSSSRVQGHDDLDEVRHVARPGRSLNSADHHFLRCFVEGNHSTDQMFGTTSVKLITIILGTRLQTLRERARRCAGVRLRTFLPRFTWASALELAPPLTHCL